MLNGDQSSVGYSKMAMALCREITGLIIIRQRLADIFWSYCPRYFLSISSGPLFRAIFSLPVRNKKIKSQIFLTQSPK
jgi:hypothetical protein